MPGSLLDNLDVFYGELTPARAMVYARLEGLQNTDGLSLSGSVCGPRCFYSKTLPATYRMQDAGPGPSLLAKSLIPDPSYWSPDTPHIYDVTVELRKGADIIASEIRQIGFRAVGIAHSFLTLEGKTWIPRAVSFDLSSEKEFEFWRTTGTVMVVEEVDQSLLEGASTKGVWIAARLRRPKENDSPDWPASLLRIISRYPAVTFAIIDTMQPNAFTVGSESPNIRIGQYLSFFRRSEAKKWGDFFVVGQGYPSITQLRERRPIPLIAATERRFTCLPFSNARRACDSLQSELAAQSQYAGYFVMKEMDSVVLT